MKVLGWIFISAGVFLCISLIFIPAGMSCIALGALLLIASALTSRARTARRELDDKEPGVSNSMFGR